MTSGQDTVAAPVVVGVDDRPVSAEALRVALVEARQRNAPLRVVTAWHYPYEAGVPLAPVLSDLDLEADARSIQEEALALVPGQDRGVRVERVVAAGWPGHVLVEAASEAQLIVVGNRGHGTVAGAVLGSVSRYVTGHAPCPVMVVRDVLAGRDRELLSGLGSLGAPEAGRLVELDEDEVVALLGMREYGRVAVVREGAPEIFPVNYALRERTVVFRTAPGTKLDWATMGPVAFEVDDIDEVRHRGWVAEVVGVGRDVTDAVDRRSAQLRGLELEPWASGERERWVAISTPRFSGRRLVDEETVEGPERARSAPAPGGASS